MGMRSLHDGEPATPPANDSRVGGSDPAPAPGKPAWVWWVAAVFVVMLGVGGFRLWRSVSDEPGRTVPELAAQESGEPRQPEQTTQPDEPSAPSWRT
jgi:hypothetical protein